MSLVSATSFNLISTQGDRVYYYHSHCSDEKIKEYMPEGLTERVYYEPSQNGREKDFKRKKIWKK